MEKRQSERKWKSNTRRSIRHQEVNFEEMVPPASFARHLGWFINGVSAAITPGGSFFRVCTSSRFWSCLVMFVCLMVLPMLAVLQLLTTLNVQVNDDIKMVLIYSSMLSVSLPVCFVWQHKIFVLGYEAKNNIRGAGYYDFNTYVRTGKHTMVLTDCVLLYLIVLVCCGISRVKVMGYVGMAAMVVLEALVVSYICYSSRLERMNMHTRGLKCQYIETHLPFFLGFSIPSVLFATWVSTHLPLAYSPFVTSVIIALSTLGSSAVRADDIGQSHRSPYILTTAHRVVSFFFPSASGRGIV